MARLKTHSEFTRLLKENYQIDDKLLDLLELSEIETSGQIQEIYQIYQYNQLKLLKAFQSAGVSEYCFSGTTGYGLYDAGREVLEKIYSEIFQTESALVRWNFVSGTHAISCALFGILRPGENFISVTGAPYDTLSPVINEGAGSLKEWDISYKEVDLDSECKVDFERLKKSIDKNTKLAFIQRSCGYQWRKSFNIEEIKQMIQFIKSINDNIVVLVDNCYGELVETSEPTQAGADIAAGSLIKNLGGTLAPTGAYLVGKSDLIKKCSQRFIAPGLEDKLGATLDINRRLYQGLFQSALTVYQSLSGAIVASFICEKLGFETNPKYNDKRTDIIQGIKLGSKKKLEVFCRGIQKATPIDCKAVPSAVSQPGYRDPIIMAGGTFIQGSSSELTADGPLREPWAVYMQGGVSAELVKVGILVALQELIKEKDIRL